VIYVVYRGNLSRKTTITGEISSWHFTRGLDLIRYRSYAGMYYVLLTTYNLERIRPRGEFRDIQKYRLGVS
jgi:hypothetical protein